MSTYRIASELEKLNGTMDRIAAVAEELAGTQHNATVDIDQETMEMIYKTGFKAAVDLIKRETGANDVNDWNKDQTADMLKSKGLLKLIDDHLADSTDFDQKLRGV